MLFGASASQVFLREQARADRVAFGARPASALHLAVPGYLLDASPLHSLLVMSPAGEADPDQGVVEIADAMSWSLAADLVMLPRIEFGQETAASSGDSLVALAWSLLVGGSPTTVVSRWPTAGAGSLVPAFYRAWLGAAPRAARPPAAQAMQKAARTLIARPGSHPADWAGLMVMELRSDR